MELLSEQIRETQSMILLTDATGTILHTVGDNDFMQRADQVALAAGVNWAEPSKGTNAIGTALFDESPVLVHAAEHYLHANSFLTCSAAPIFDPRGNILGVLDVTGDQHSYPPHTMGLVRMSARMIENHWLTEEHRHRLRLHFHSRPEFIGTLMEGIVVAGPDGRLLGANRSALDQLGMSGAQLRMQSLATLFGTSVPALLDHFRSPLAVPLAVHAQGGPTLQLVARYNPRLLDTDPTASDTAVMPAARPAVVSPATLPGPVPDIASDDTTARACPVGGGTAPRGGVPAFSGLQYLLTGCPQVQSLVDKIRRILDRDIPLLILGETGTGKELVARAVHHDSRRARQPFVAVNCASIPESLIEAELFGYEDGAFTGARRKGAVGRILQANGGTLFLDEIGDMPLSLQARLLRVLQERQVTPLGSSKSIPVDVAVIGATHRHLREMIEQGLFREDLYYRLNSLTVRLPALRDRPDLMAVAQRILLGLRSQEAVPVTLSPRVTQLFLAYHWPGNIRQLSNVLRTASVMATGESVITEDHLSDDFLEDLQRQAQAAPMRADAEAAPVATGVAAPAPEAWSRACNGSSAGAQTAPPRAAGSAPAWAAPAWPADVDATRVDVPHAPAATRPPALSGTPPAALPTESTAMRRTLDEIERDSIRQALEACGGNISEASKRLGISRNTIYRKLRWNRG